MSAGNRKHMYRHPPKPIHVQKTEFYHYVAFALIVITMAALLAHILR